MNVSLRLVLVAAVWDAASGALAEFGGCYSSSMNDVRCAFNGTECSASETWKTPAEVSALGLGLSCDCASTDIGACYDVVSTHVSTCHVHESQCPTNHPWTPAGYVYSDGHECRCAVNRGVGSTAFGACISPTSGQITCGIDWRSCADGEVWVDPVEGASFYDVDCDCSSVLVGACVDPMTQTPNCAVDEWSCNDGDEWWDPRTTESNGYECLLCDESDLVWPTSEPTTTAAAATVSIFGGAEFGGCYDSSLNARRCEYNSSHCGPEEAWMTPVDLAMAGQNPCSCEDTEIGACYTVTTDHVATCHVHPNQCPDDTIWIDAGYVYGSGHTCLCDRFRDKGLTQYGACWDGGTMPYVATCAYQKADCSAGETWVEPQEALKVYGFECNCDDVLTGACESAITGELTCAVDIDSCEDDDEWISARDVAAAGTSCRICGTNTPSPTPAPTSAPTRAPTVSPVKIDLDGDKKDDESSGVTLIIVVAVVVVVVVAVIAVGAIFTITQRARGGVGPMTALANEVEMASEVRVVGPADPAAAKVAAEDNHSGL